MTVLLLGCKPCDAPSTPDAFIEQVKSLLDKAASDDGIGCHLANRGFLVKNGIDDRDFEGSLYSTAAFKADDSSESAVAVLNHVRPRGPR